MLADALSRTILLAKTDLRDDTPEDVVLNALRSTAVVLLATDDCLDSHAGQCCFVSVALTLARSGHSVWLVAPDRPIVGPQPPLRKAQLIQALKDIGSDLLPGLDFHFGPPSQRVDLAVLIGPPEYPGEADQVARLGWSKWSGRLSSESGQSCMQTEWPIGAMAAASFACAEAFKAAMRKLREFARVPPWLFDQMFAPSNSVQIALAPEEASTNAALGRFDVVSGGAITNSALFALLRLPGAQGSCRVIDDDENELSNLNRNALLLHSNLARLEKKVSTLANYGNGLTIEPCALRYDENFCGDLAENVLVGVDHIPSRWAVQRSWPTWLGVGATDTFSAYVSFHTKDEPCVGCLHPEPLNVTAPIPTVAFVSLFAGLMLGVYFVRSVNGELDPTEEQQAYITMTRPETWAQGLVVGNASCPVDCDFAKAARSG